MIYKCPGCGGALRFDPQANKMICDYCGAIYEASEITGNASQMNAVDNQNINTVNEEYTEVSQDEDGDYIQYNIYSCTSCGGELRVNGVETSTYCIYCGQPTIIFSRMSKEESPKYILPFSVTKETAIRSIRQRLGDGKYIPDEIKNFEMDRIRGIYIPYWLCGMDYWDEQSLSGEVGSGDNKTTYYYYRCAQSHFNNITLDASERLNDDVSQRLEPFDMNKVVPFQASYMSGFYGDRYDVDIDTIRPQAIGRAKELFDKQVEKSVSASNIKIVRNAPKVNNFTAEYAMLPAWFLTFRYENRPYTFLVNGQSGKVVGAVPYDETKVNASKFSLSLVLGIIFAFIGGFILSALAEGDNLIETIIAGVMVAVFLFAGASAKFKRVHEKIELTRSKTMTKFVKDRNE